MPDCDPTDLDLIARARRGDLAAFNALVSRWDRRVYSYLLRSARSREDALDLCQEVFLKAYRGLNGLVAPERFASWLFRIAHNELVSARRRPRPVVDSPGLDRAADSVAFARARLGDFGYRGAELSYLVEQALSSLPLKQREAVLLRVHYGFKFNEIAGILGCPVSTAKSRLYAGLAALRDLLEPVAA